MICEPLLPKRGKWQRMAENGQSLVEVAISSIFFLVILIGVFDLGRAYYIYVTLEDSAGEAATFLALYPSCATATDCADPRNATWRAQNAVSENLDFTDTSVEVSYPTVGKSIGNLVRVRVSYDFELLTPIIQDIVGDNQLVISADASQVILQQ